MQNNKVVITGIGIISSLGEGVDAHWQALQDGSVRLQIVEGA